MANVFAITNGNWNSASTWDTNSVPTSADVVYTNGYTVTIDADVNVNQLRSGSNNGQLPNMIVPVMTSNTTPSGVASASFNNTTAFNAFNGVGWTTGNTTVPYTLTYQFDTPKIIKRFRIVALYNSGPNAFTFEGSNDGSTWTSLGSFTGSNSSPAITISPVLANTTAYLYYRINVTTKHGALNTTIYNFDMTESSAVTNGTTSTLVLTGGTYSVASLPALPTQRTITVSNSSSGIVNNSTSNQVIQISASTGTINLNHATAGNLIGGDNAGFQNTFSIITTTAAFTGTLNITGNIAGQTSAWQIRDNAGLLLNGSCTVNVIGNLTAGNGISAGCNAIWIASTATLAVVNVTGNLIGQQVNLSTVGSTAIYSASTGASSINVTGNITGSLFPAIFCISTSNTAVNVPAGTLTASNSSIALNNSGGGIVTLNSPMINTNTYNSVYSNRIRFYSTAQVQWLFQNSAGSNTILYSAGASLGMPLTTNVRSGVVYGGNNELTGVLVMPLPSNVRIGVPTDNTTGTGELTAEDFLNAIQSSSNVSAIRLKNVSTVDTTGNQLAAYL